MGEHIKAIIKRYSSISHAALPTVKNAGLVLQSWDPGLLWDDKVLVKIKEDHAMAEEIQTSNQEMIKNYLARLEVILKSGIFGKRLDQEETCALLLMAFSELDNVTAKYKAYYLKFKGIKEGRKIFAGICSIMPWPVEETWRVILRAESTILQAQSAKFLPELVQYAVCMCINPEIVALGSTFSIQDITIWKYMVIPTLLSSYLYVLDEKIEKEIYKNPHRYLTRPRYYTRTLLHRHVRYGTRTRSRRTSLHYHSSG